MCTAVGALKAAAVVLLSTLAPVDHGLLVFQGTVFARQKAAAVVRGDAELHKLFTVMAQRYADREGGYTRVLRSRRRNNDAAQMAYIECVACWLSVQVAFAALVWCLLSAAQMCPAERGCLRSFQPPCNASNLLHFGPQAAEVSAGLGLPGRKLMMYLTKWRVTLASTQLKCPLFQCPIWRCRYVDRPGEIRPARPPRKLPSPFLPAAAQAAATAP